MSTFIITGLGNPGPRYQWTRHNAGFLFLDRLAASENQSINRKNFSGITGEWSYAGHRLILLKPQTFMNRSGLSVMPALQFHKLPLSQLIVVHDELDLPYGTVRFKKGGGHGGHNGLRSIMEQLGTGDFIRLRIGIEAAAEASEELMNKYLEEGDLSEAEIKLGLRTRTISTEIQPMLCGTAFKNKGVQRMLDAVIDFLPSPVDIPPVAGTDENEQETTRKADDGEKFSALAFKLMTDPFVGQLTFVRVYSGVLTKGDTVFNPVKGKKERIGRIVQMHANNRQEIEEIRAGDIAACVGLKEVTTGETLCDPDSVVTLERMVFPEPVISQAVEPKTKTDQEKMGIALQRLAAEDPSFRVRTDEESGQTIISGMGELHLEIIVDRMKREFGVEANVGKPQVAYRETIRKKVTDVEGKFVRQSGGKGQYGHVVFTVEPSEAGKGFEFVDAIKGGVVPREFIPAVEKGVIEAINTGVLAGFPVVDVKVTLTFGSYHDVDSNENAFKMAAIFGFKEGCKKANPVILEPMMAVEVETPEDYAGNVMGDLSSRRGMVQGMDDMPGGGKAIKAEVPLSEMFGYSTTLRSMSQGRATYTMEFKHYSEAPRNVAEAIVAARAK